MNDPEGSRVLSSNSRRLTSQTHDSSSSYDFYDNLYDYLKGTNFTESERLGSVEVVSPISAWFGDSQITTSQELALLHITTILYYSTTIIEENGKKNLIRYDGSYTASVGLLMGIYHFNNGIGKVVKEVTGINETCNVRLTAEIFDSEASQMTAVDAFIKQLQKFPGRLPSALFGSHKSSVSVPLAILSGLYEIPHISPLSTSTDLNDRTQFKYFSRLIPSDAGTAKFLVEYFRSRLDLTHCGVLFINDAYGGSYVQAFKENAVNRPEGDQITVRSFGFTYGSEEELKLTVRQMKDTEYKVFFAVLYNEHFETIMTEAVRLGIAGPGYVWIFSDGIRESLWKGRKFQKDSPMAIASQGIGIIKAYGGVKTSSGDSGFDRFVEAWYDQDDEAVQYYNHKQPKNNTMNNADDLYYKADLSYFKSDQSHPPSFGSIFLYDSAIGLGLAACRLALEKGRDKRFFDGEELLSEFIRSSFEGASGKIQIDPETATRVPSSAMFALYNVNGFEDGEDVSFKFSIVSHTVHDRHNSSDAVVWQDIHGESFIYSDGTTQHPPVLPPIQGENFNQLGNVRYVGWALSAIILLCSMFFAFWAYWYRERRIAKIAQPVFLVMICVGTFMMGSAIIAFSIDDQIVSIHACNVACMITPWFSFLGFTIVFCALFSKIWRINKIFHSLRVRQVKVKVKDVMIPFVILFSLNTIILMVWTLVSPLQWKRSIIPSGTDQFGRPLESYGECKSSGNSVVYVTLLLIVNLGVVILANIQAYQARSIFEEFSGATHISIAMASMLQASVIGIPVLALAMENPPIFFVVASGIVFVICMSLLLIIFVPELIQVRAEGKQGILVCREEAKS